MPEPARTIGAYEIERQLGTGRHGRTFLAHLPTGEKAALREIACDSLATAQRITTNLDLKRLATVIAGLSHVGLANTLDIFGVGKRVYVAQEFLDTPSLASLLDKGGPLPVEEVWRIGCQLLTALEFGHLRGLLHLDLRPENVHYDREQQHAVLTDFGHMQLLLELRPQLALAQVADRHHAPEIHEGYEPTPASEVYSIGVILYQLLTGHLPSAPHLAEETASGGRFQFLEVGRGAAQAELEKDWLEQIAGQWPGVVSVVRRALAPTTAHRYQRASRMHEALAQAHRADAQGLTFTEERQVVVAEEPRREAPKKAVRVEGGVRFCEKCGRPIPPGSKVCVSCGSPRPRRAAIKLAPQRREPESYFQRHADHLLVEGKYEQAEEAYRMAAQRRPDDPVAQRDLADVLVVNRKFAEAEQAYRSVLRSHPDDLEARHELGRVLVNQGKGREAVHQFKKVLAGEPDEVLRLSALTQLGAAHASCGDYGSARGVWKQVLQEDPSNARVHFCVASSYLAENNEVRARRHLREALRADPDYGDARNALRQLDQRAEAEYTRQEFRDGMGPTLWLVPGFWRLGLAMWLVDAGLRGIGSLVGRERWGGRATRAAQEDEEPPSRKSGERR